MDRVKAEILEKALVGNLIQGWTIRSLISNGKSAAVFLADGKDGEVAVKVFDTELIARYGDDTQFARIDRERELIGKSHPWGGALRDTSMTRKIYLRLRRRTFHSTSL